MIMLFMKRHKKHRPSQIICIPVTNYASSNVNVTDETIFRNLEPL